MCLWPQTSPLPSAGARGRSGGVNELEAEAMTGPDVVVLGDVMADVTVQLDAAIDRGIARRSDTPARITFGDGGAGGNVAARLAAAGVRTGLICAIGDDAPGRGAVVELRASGVEVHATVVGGATGAVVALVEPGGERTMLTARGANIAMTPADLPGHWFRAGAHLHLSGYSLFADPVRRAARRALALAGDAGMTCSVDPGSWAPLTAAGPQRFLSWTAGIELCLPNADEACVLTGSNEPAAAARLLAAHYGAVVVTDGARGAVWSDGVAVVVAPATIAPVRDTIGAGDAFTAGWLSAPRGAPPQVSLRHALRSAAQAVGQRGARPSSTGTGDVPT